MMDVQEWLDELRRLYPDITLIPPADEDVIDEATKALGSLPKEITLLLGATNGLSCRSFRLYSAFDRANAKKTWESLQRANDPGKTSALGANPDLLQRFLVFADIGNGYAAWDRENGSIWFEQQGSEQLRETDLSFWEFIETMVRNVE